MNEAVLAVRLRALGDVVLTTPALRALKRGHPDAALEVVTEARYAPLLEGLPEVDRVWALERSAAATGSLLLALRRRRYRWAVDFFGNARSALITRLAGARCTAGFALRGRRYAYRVRVSRDAPGPHGRREPASAAHLRLATAVGGRADAEPPRIAMSEAARSEASRLLAAAGIARPERTVGLVAAGTWATKTWPASHAAQLARRLGEAGREVLLLAGPGEQALTATVVALAPELRTLPRCGVGAMAGVIARLEAVVGTDSGPRHVAAALGVPTYAWFGPTHPDTWQPAGDLHGYWQSDLPCRGCDRTRCPHWSCLPALAPEVAARRVLEHLGALERPRGERAVFDPAAGP